MKRRFRVIAGVETLPDKSMGSSKASVRKSAYFFQHEGIQYHVPFNMNDVIILEYLYSKERSKKLKKWTRYQILRKAFRRRSITRCSPPAVPYKKPNTRKNFDHRPQIRRFQ